MIHKYWQPRQFMTHVLCTVFMGALPLTAGAYESTNNIQPRVLNVSESSFSRPLGSEFMCFNINTLIVENLSETGFLNASKTLKPGVLRIPGGTVANYWDWKRGGLITQWDNLPSIPNQFKLPRVAAYKTADVAQYLDLFKATGAKGMLVLNMLTSDLPDQLDYIREAISVGLPIEYIELGNELYEGKKNYVHQYPTPASYAETAKEWALAIKKEFPDLKVSVIGANPRIVNRKIKDKQRLTAWNPINIDVVLPEVDAMTFHEYQRGRVRPSSRYSGGYFGSNSHGGNEQNVISDSQYAGVFKGQQTQSKTLLGSLMESYPEGKNIWITEFNMLPDQQPSYVTGRWVHGLYVASMTGAFLETPEINIVCNHVLIGNSDFGAIYADTDFTGIPAIKGTSVNNSSIDTFSMTAVGHALGLFSSALEGGTEATRLSFTHPHQGRTQQGLYGWLFSGEGVQNTIVMNVTDKPMKIQSSTLFNHAASYVQYFGKPNTLVKSAEDLSMVTGEAHESIHLEPYSITHIHKK